MDYKDLAIDIDRALERALFNAIQTHDMTDVPSYMISQEDYDALKLLHRRLRYGY